MGLRLMRAASRTLAPEAPALNRSQNLATDAQMAGSAADHDAPNLRRAYGTGLSAPTIHAMKPLECAGLSVGIPVVAQRTATMAQCPSKRLLDRAAQAVHLLPRQIARPRQGVDSRCKQRLVHVDVPQSRDHSLIEQRALDRAPRSAHKPRKVRRPQRQGLGTQIPSAVVAPEPPDAPESPWILESQLHRAAASRKFHPHVRVFACRTVDLLDRESAGHSKVNVETLAAVEFEHDPLAAPMHFHNPSAAHATVQSAAAWPNDFNAPDDRPYYT
jgi:hypothetical protein